MVSVRERLSAPGPRSSVDVAAYSDLHPHSFHLPTDARLLVDKVRAGADFVTTPMLTALGLFPALRG